MVRKFLVQKYGLVRKFGSFFWFGNLVRKFSLGGCKRPRTEVHVWPVACVRLKCLLAQARVMDADGGMDDDDAAIGQVLDAASDAELDDVLEAAARLRDKVYKRRGA